MSLLSPLPSLGSSVFEGATSPSTSTASQSSSPVTNEDWITRAAGILAGTGAGTAGAGLGPIASTSQYNEFNADTTPNPASQLSWGRVAAFVVGLLLIGGGILMFRQTQIVIQGATRTGRRIAEVAAL